MATKGQIERERSNLQQSVMAILVVGILLAFVYVLFWYKAKSPEEVSTPDIQNETVNLGDTLDPDVADTSDER